jgi:hypothetical protein
MAKSRLSKERTSKGGGAQLNPAVADPVFVKNIGGTSANVDMSSFFYAHCDKLKAKKTDRVSYISIFIKNIRQAVEAGENNLTLYTQVNNLNYYLIYCDSMKFSAFTGYAIKAYYHELIRASKVYENRKSFLFQHSDGECLGFKKSTAKAIFSSLRFTMENCGCPAYRMTQNLAPIGSGDPNPNEALSRNERDIFLEKVQVYFFEIAAQLLALEGTEVPAVISIQVDNCPLLIGSSREDATKKQKGKDFYSYAGPFNQAMQAAYYLLSFYSGFNDSQLSSLGRDIEIDKSKSKSNHFYYNIKARKPRSGGKLVKATIGGHVDKSSWKFLSTLIDISEKYDTTNSGLLIYSKSIEGEIKNIHPASYRARMMVDLFITADTAHLVTEYIASQFISVVQEKKRLLIQTTKSLIGSKVSKQWVKVTQPQKVAPDMAFAVLAVISGLGSNIKDIQAGLDINKLQHGKIQVTYKKQDAAEGSFVCDSKYYDFLVALEKYSAKVQKYPGPGYPKTSYLIPFGSNSSFITQWNGLCPNRLCEQLKKIGIRHGEYFLSLNSSRIRETYARISRQAGEGDDVVALILNNSLATVFKHYSTGNRDESRQVMHEALKVMHKIINGSDLQDAIERVLEELDIPVLSIHDPTYRKGKVNAAGFFCDGKNKPNSHKVTETRAKRLGIDTDNLPCFQYDKCIDCKSAKLVDDEDALYRSLSCAEAIASGAEYFPEQFEELIKYSQKLKAAITHNISKKMTGILLNRIHEEGLHYLYRNTHAIAGMHVNKG